MLVTNIMFANTLGHADLSVGIANTPLNVVGVTLLKMIAFDISAATELLDSFHVF